MTPATLQALALLGFCIPAEAARELCYKQAVDAACAAGGLWPGLLRRPLFWLGLLLWGVELVAWLGVLQRLPLSLAFPLMALSYAVIPVVADRVLGERLDRGQWWGVGLITAGVALVGLGGL